MSQLATLRAAWPTAAAEWAVHNRDAISILEAGVVLKARRSHSALVRADCGQRVWLVPAVDACPATQAPQHPSTSSLALHGNILF